MAPTAVQETPSLDLRVCATEDYCRAILAVPGVEMWWFQTGGAPYAGFSRPFQDRQGLWWWVPRPRLAWPVDFFQPFDAKISYKPRCDLFAWQYPVRPELSNSKTCFNVIHDISGFDLKRIASQKQRAVRKGIKGLSIVPLDINDVHQTEEARVVWNSHVERTGWNATFDSPTFDHHWRPLAGLPGTNVLGARDAEKGELCAWLIAKIVGGTVYVDTIASHTERLDWRPNDTIIYLTLLNAARIDGVRHANYFLRSSLEPLEKFKASLGFDSSGIPSYLHVNPLVALGLRFLKPDQWRRLNGEFQSHNADSPTDLPTESHH